jgi:response regulator RpfG family c-di-GMP phosphodiesterase
MTMDTNQEKVLLVDDNQNLLSAVKRQFHNKIDLVTAPGGADGLAAIEYEGPFAVVVSDMQMPYMDGVEFLAKVRELSPDSIRMMLTGNANLQVAMDSVNEGNIFRFLTKPCSQEVLYDAVLAGLKQYRLHQAEKQLLNRTLKGAVALLTDVLSLVNPVAFSRASRIKRYVGQMVEAMKLEDAWSYELAAMLVQLGCIALPPELMEKASSGAELSDEERKVFATHPGIASRLLQHIPRLETVAAMVARQQESGDLPKLNEPFSDEDKAILGGHLLKVAIAYDEQLAAGKGDAEAIAYLHTDPHAYDPGIVEVLDSVSGDRHAVKIVSLDVSQLQPGMIIDQDISSKSGVLFVAKGQEVTATLYYRLLGLQESGLISGTLRMVVRKEG